MGVQVQGARECAAALKAVDEALVKGLRAAGLASAKVVEAAARSRVPVRRGRLRSSIRARASVTSASVSAGSKAVPYAGVTEYGGYVPSRGHTTLVRHTARPFLRPAADASQKVALAIYEREVAALITKAGL